MSTRLHLRRIMHNEGPASTSELTEEEVLQTIISLQGGKTFGRAQDNKVIFVEDVPNQEKGQPNISRSHAEVFHVQTGEGETYLVEDRSENGTYVNDLRLTKKTKQVLQSGDLIKFGHKNGSAFQPGDIALQTHADWTFLVETPNEKAVAMKQTSTVRIFQNSPIIEQVDQNGGPKEDSPVGRSTVVRQQEADSTNQEFLVEPQLFGSSSNEHNIPSTSQSYASDVDRKLMEISRTIVEQIDDVHFEERMNNALPNAQGIPPTVIETVRNIDLSRASSKEEKIQAIFNEIKQAMERQRENSPSSSVRRQSESVAVVDADSSNDVSPPLDSNSSAFHPAVVPVTHPLLVPQPTNPADNLETFVSYLQNICVPQHLIQAIAHRRQMLFPAIDLLEITRCCLYQYNTFQMNSLNYILAFYNHQGDREYGVIRAVGNNRVVRRDTPDENRHSASSGSTTHSRLRTFSEESEIVDVVGTDEAAEPLLALEPADQDQDEQDEQENDENADPFFPAAAPLEYEIPENLSEGGTETPSPGPESGEPLQAINALAEHNARDEEEVRREEPNSHASSALGSPIGSPIQSIPSNSPAPVVEDIVVDVEINEPAPIEEVAENRAEERATPVPQEVVEVANDNDKEAKEEEERRKKEQEELAEAQRQKEEEARLRKEKLKKKRQEAAERKRLAAAEAEKKQKAESAAAVKEKKKSRDTRRMKQLDSEESDSDDAENQKRSVRRSTRGKPTTSVEEPAVEEENDDDDSDAPVVDSPESRKLKRKRNQTGNRVSVRKSSARKSQVGEEAAAGESTAEDGEADSDEPKRKRGRKKENSADVSLDNPNHPKNLCGVTEEYCIASYIDLTPKGSGVQWVQCETKGCQQWFHSYCVCLDNMRFKKRKNAHLRFYCCGPKMSVEATEGRNGDVYRRFEETYEDEDDEAEQTEEKATSSRKPKQEIKKSAR